MGRSDNEKLIRDSQSSFYDNWYLERGATPVLVEDTTIINHLRLSKHSSSFLDAGCGTGRLTHQIAINFPNLKVYGLDLSEKSLKVLKNKGAPNIITKQFDFSKDSIESIGMNNIETILSMQMIQHLDKAGAKHAIIELHKALATNGLLVVELYNYNGYNRINERKSNKNISKVTEKDLFYEYRYDALEFRKFALESAPFKSAKVYGCQNISRRWLNKFPFLKSFDMLLGQTSVSHLFGYYFICVLEK